MKPFHFLCNSGALKAKNLVVTALFLGLTASVSFSQTEPSKPQLPTTPMPAASPAQPPGTVISPEAPEPDERVQQPQQQSSNAAPQREKSKSEAIPFKDRLMVNGNFGLQFGDITLIDLSPMVGYKFSDRFVAGPGVMYQYLGLKNYGSYHIYGGKVFGRAAVFEKIFAHTEYELLNLPRLTQNPATKEIDETRTNISSLLVGGGYRLMIGDM